MKRIIKQKYYFDPKYYNWDVNTRIIYSLDQRVGIQLNFNFTLIDSRYLFFILSLMQLEILGLISGNDKDKLISIVADYLSLKVSYSKKQRFAFFRRIVNGKEVERSILILTSEEYSKVVETWLVRTGFYLKDGKFVSQPRDST